MSISKKPKDPTNLKRINFCYCTKYRGSTEIKGQNLCNFCNKKIQKHQVYIPNQIDTKKPDAALFKTEGNTYFILPLEDTHEAIELLTPLQDYISDFIEPYHREIENLESTIKNLVLQLRSKNMAIHQYKHILKNPSKYNSDRFLSKQIKESKNKQAPTQKQTNPTSEE